MLPQPDVTRKALILLEKCIQVSLVNSTSFLSGPLTHQVSDTVISNRAETSRNRFVQVCFGHDALIFQILQKMSHPHPVTTSKSKRGFGGPQTTNELHVARIDCLRLLCVEYAQVSCFWWGSVFSLVYKFSTTPASTASCTPSLRATIRP